MNWFDVLVIIILIYCLISGYKSGLIKQLTALVGIVVAAMLSGKVADFILPYVQGVNKIPDYIPVPLSFIIAFLVILCIFFAVGGMLESIIKTLKMGFLNKICGSIFCIIKWTFVLSIILNLLLALDKERTLVNKNIEKESQTFSYIQQLAPAIIPYLKFDILQKHL